jgi:hypothetical protein
MRSGHRRTTMAWPRRVPTAPAEPDRDGQSLLREAAMTRRHSLARAAIAAAAIGAVSALLRSMVKAVTR